MTASHPVSADPARAARVLDRLAGLAAHDLPTHGGRTLAYVYDSGLAEADEIGRRALADFGATNALDPTVFPSLLAMENDLVGFAARLLHAPDGVVGTVTSGGTESILLAVLAARDARPDVAHPRMVLPVTAHAAFHKAAHYFGLALDLVDVDAGFRADPQAAKAAIGPDTVLVVASAPSYAHGVVDPVPAIAAAAAERDVRCHVDACIGGWVLPYFARLGDDLPAWDFAAPGVTSVSVDLHKYAYTPKGASLLLHRTSRLRRPQLYADADWPGYTMLNATTQSTKSGGPLAAAWAVVTYLGDDGYLALARQVHEAMGVLTDGVEAIDHLAPVAAPDATLLALGTDDALDVFTLADLLGSRGWYVQPQLRWHEHRPSLHLSLSAGTAPHVDRLVADLTAATAEAVTAGPVRLPDELAAAMAELDPAAVDEAAFTGLLQLAGLAGPDGRVELPERMGPVNALLDAASPRLREALLTGFLDRLLRPSL